MICIIIILTLLRQYRIDPMSELKKVLIVTYYWPPAGGPAIQRTLKFVKYMRFFGWEPVILTVENGEYPAIDPSLIQEIPDNIQVYKTRAFQLFQLYRMLTGKKGNTHNNANVFGQKDTTFVERLAKWIRLNLFIPDARIGWYAYAIKAAKKIIEQEHIDLIYSSSPPHSLQLIAQKIAKQNKIKWVADFRDPWSELVHYQSYKRTWLTRKIDSHFEKSVFRSADRLVAAANDYATCIKTHVDRKIEVIYNGYDPSDFPKPKSRNTEDFLITYTGELSEDRIPHALLRALSRLEHSNIKLQFIGNTCPELKQEIQQLNLGNKVILKPYMPHIASIAELQQSDLLLLVINQVANGKGIVPGKIFEYLGTRKPILCLGDPTGEAGEIIKTTNSGFCIAHHNEEEIFTLLSRLSSGVLPGLSFQTEQFERKNETGQLCDIFNTLVNKPS